jgi:hypothetical protein
LISNIVPGLQYRMRKRYYEVVRKCLTSDFGQSEIQSETQVEVRERLQWMKNVERHAVSELEKCIVKMTLPRVCSLEIFKSFNRNTP